MILLLVAFVAFALVLDMISAIALPYPPWGRIVATVEEGGEMVVMSVIVGFVFRTWHQRPSWRSSARGGTCHGWSHADQVLGAP